MFGSADDLRVFKLPQPVPELLSVADRFQVKPLIRSVQRDGRYRFLALSLARAGAFGGVSMPFRVRSRLLLMHDPAEAALRTGGEVIVLEPARMPSGTGPAAVFRYKAAAPSSSN
ncbi:MAG TPA: hypothetical protein VF745_16545 [Steroidobacteraceae bacterium]